MKKLLCSIMILSMLLALAAFASPAFAERSAVMGTTRGNHYENAFFSIQADVPDNWRILSEDEFAAMMGIGREYLYEDAQEPQDETFQHHVFYAIVNSNEGDNVGMTVQKLNKLQVNSLDEKGIAEITMASLEPSSLGDHAEITSATLDSCLFAGKEHPCIEVTVEAYGVPIYQRQIYMKVADYYAVVNLSSLDESKLETLASYFKELRPAAETNAFTDPRISALTEIFENTNQFAPPSAPPLNLGPPPDIMEARNFMLSLDDGSLSKKSDGKYRGFILGIKADFPEDWVFLDRTEANAAFGEDAKNLSPKKLIEKYGQYCDLKASPEIENGESLTIAMSKLDIPADMTRLEAEEYVAEVNLETVTKALESIDIIENMEIQQYVRSFAGAEHPCYDISWTICGVPAWQHSVFVAEDGYCGVITASSSGTDHAAEMLDLFKAF